MAKAMVVDSLNSLGCFLTAIDKSTPTINKTAFKAPNVAKNAVWYISAATAVVFVIWD